ncbi:hypothetical protein [Paraburkholderia sp. BL6665CI2N2]|uniref:hypothetical protein n=1 Tax=Paraburkholderia sp. BL6665CI2N2 TaxID=1938806 RepID=UPI0014170C14|nr:hypothetical protein [Paraburkholderia sp. BL6665CI2N2]
MRGFGKEADSPPGKKRTMTWLWLEIVFLEGEANPDPCSSMVAECGSGVVWVNEHRQLGVCGTNTKSRTTHFLTTDERLGDASATPSYTNLAT